MFKNWRISSVNGALLAAYFIPAWTMVAFNIMVAPVHGLYERPSVAVALYISDHLQCRGNRAGAPAWLLALGTADRGGVLRDFSAARHPRRDPQERRLRRGARRLRSASAA